MLWSWVDLSEEICECRKLCRNKQRCCISSKFTETKVWGELEGEENGKKKKETGAQSGVHSVIHNTVWAPNTPLQENLDHFCERKKQIFPHYYRRMIWKVCAVLGWMSPFLHCPFFSYSSQVQSFLTLLKLGCGLFAVFVRSLYYPQPCLKVMSLVTHVVFGRHEARKPLHHH